MNKPKKLLAKAAVLILLVSGLTVHGLQAETTIEITADGFGASPEQADVAALRAAVKKAVGTFVDSETLIDKEEVIKDQVLTHSDGFVEKVIDPGSPKQVQEGFWKVTKTVLVRKGKLVEKLKAGGLVTATIAGEDIWAQEVSKIQNVNDGRELLKKFHQENTMSKLLVARQIDAQGNVGDQAKPEIKTDYDTGKTTLTFSIQIYYDLEAYYKQYAPKLIKLLDQIMVVADESWPVDYKVSRGKVESYGAGAVWRNITGGMFVNISRDKLGKQMRYKVYSFPQDGGEYYAEDLLKLAGWAQASNRSSYASNKNQYYEPKEAASLPKLEIFVMDKSGGILRQSDFFGGKLSNGRHYNHRYQPGRHVTPTADQMFLVNGREKRFVYEPRFVSTEGGEALVDSLTYTYTIEMDAEDTKKLGSIQMRFP